MGLGDKMFSGLAWSAIEKLAIQIMQFSIGIILARLLTPEEYGTIGILLVFIAISKVFINSGFTQALIQKQERTEKDISSVFFFNILISLVCYAALFFGAPFIADYYKIPLLSPLLKLLAISLIINALFAVPATLLTIKMDFKTLSKVTLTATLVSGGIAIAMAYSGYGVWALAWQTVVRAIVVASLVWFFIQWRPKLLFSRKSIKELFKFGSNLLAGSLLNTTVNNFYALFIAKVISTKDLGYYTRGTQFADIIFSFVSTTMNRVLFPGLVSVQNDVPKLIEHTKRIIKSVAILIVPIFVFIALMAKPIILVLLTDKWLQAVPIMQFLCFARLITIISSINVNLLKVIGRTDLILRQQFVKIAIRVALFFVFLKYGIVYIALGELISTLIHFFINTYYPGKIMDYGAARQLKDMRKIGLAGLLMALALWAINFLITNSYLSLTLGLLVSAGLYLFLIRALKISELDFLKDKAMKFLKPKS